MNKLSFLGFSIILCVSATAAPNYQTDILPLFKESCLGCHNPDKMKADLDLTTHAGVMKGGSSGVCVKPGSADSSLLYRVVAHLEEPEMPPKKPQLATAQLELIKQWIAGGCIEAEGGVASKSRGQALEALLPTKTASNEPGPMPGKLPVIKPSASKVSGPAIAMAASPNAPLLAVGGHERILLFDTDSQALLGSLPFQERTVHFLRFSHNGQVLLAAGGHGSHSGKAVLFDVKSGKRLSEVATESTDSILAADVSPDLTQIACGGPDKLVKIYSTKDGQLVRKVKKHTDWVTSVAFSPDGDKLATGDRSGGLHLWATDTGTILYTLAEHQGRIASLSWRADSSILASAGEDGKMILWDTAEGWAAKSSTPHNTLKEKPKGTAFKVPGVTSVDFAPDGRLLTTGRDNAVRLFLTNGNQQLALPELKDLPTRAVVGHTGKWFATGDFAGGVKLYFLPPATEKATAEMIAFTTQG
jgi:WD40 repeat protein